MQRNIITAKKYLIKKYCLHLEGFNPCTTNKFNYKQFIKHNNYYLIATEGVRTLCLPLIRVRSSQSGLSCITYERVMH